MAISLRLFAFVFAFSSVVLAQSEAPDLSAVTGALSSSNTEIRTGIFPAVVGIMTAILLIAVAAGIVRLIARNN